MHTYDKAYTVIMEKGFSEVEHVEFDELGVVCYEKNHLHVVLQNWDKGMTIDGIEKECQIIRSTLLGLNANVWNAYYIVCSNFESLDDEMAFFIERSSTSLRKYVVREESDLDRIPFLDSIPVIKMDNAQSLTEGFAETDSIIHTLFSEIKKHNGHTTNLNKKIVKNVVDFILSDEGKTI